MIHPCQLSQGKCTLHGSYVKLETKTVRGIYVEKSRNLSYCIDSVAVYVFIIAVI